MIYWHVCVSVCVCIVINAFTVTHLVICAYNNKIYVYIPPMPLCNGPSVNKVLSCLVIIDHNVDLLHEKSKSGKKNGLVFLNKCKGNNKTFIAKRTSEGWQNIFISCVLFLRRSITFNINIMKEEMFYLTTHSTHFIYGYMASDIW